MDAQSIYEFPSVSRCSVFVVLSIAALGIDRPQRRSMTTARQANLVHPTFEKSRTAALDLIEFLRFFASIKLPVNIYFQKLRPLVFLLPPLMAAAGYGPGHICHLLVPSYFSGWLAGAHGSCEFGTTRYRSHAVTPVVLYRLIHLYIL